MTSSRIIRTTIAVLCCVVISVAIILLNNGWVSLFYATVLAFFPNEIKQFVGTVYRYFVNRRVRITCSYLFRIMYANKYLLVDERGMNVYSPVGGVYKYQSKDIRVDIEFEGEYDGLHGMGDDTEDDLRLIISSRKSKAFFYWFETGEKRENVKNLTREFREELIDSKILPKDSVDAFKKLSYAYIGSHEEKGKNSYLGLPQIQKNDIFCILLTDDQKIALKRLSKLRTESEKPRFIFASSEEIDQGYCDHDGFRCVIASTANLIVANKASTLTKNDKLKGVYSPCMHE